MDTEELIVKQLQETLNLRAEARATQLAAEHIRRLDLVPRGEYDDRQPTAHALLVEILKEIKRAGSRSKGTFVGSYQVVLKVAQDMEIHGAERIRPWRRSRAETERLADT